MSDDLDNEHPDIVQMREHIKTLEKQNKDLAPKAERADKAERTLAFAQAGLDISSSKAKYFMAGYDGELDPEKIKEAALTDGFLDAPAEDAAAAKAAADQADRDALARRQEAITGEPVVPADFHERLNAAKTQEEALKVITEAGLPTPSMHGT